MRRAACALAACLSLTGAASAQEDDDEALDEIVVTATRTYAPAKDIPGSATVVTARDIEEGQSRTVADALMAVPAVDLVLSGGAGQLSEVLIRGANPEHTLVLVDGIKINDTMLFGGKYNFAHLGTENVEQIEILRGPQSLIHGSYAVGGVVNVVTKTGGEDGDSSVSLEGGSYATVRASAVGGGRIGAAGFAVSVSHTRADGFSAAGEDYGNTEPDGYENTSVAGKLTFAPSESRSVDVILRYMDGRTDVDDGGGAGADDPNRERVSQQTITGVRASLGDSSATWRQKIGLSLVSHHTEDNDDSDPVDVGEYRRDTFDSRWIKFDWQNNVRLGGRNDLLFGVEAEQENGESSSISEEGAELSGLYIRDELRLAEESSVSFGARVDDHSLFGAEATWKLATAHLFPRSGTRLKATVGTGFKAPSLYQLYSSYGDPGLMPEESLGWDMGLERAFAGGAASVGVTYFRNDFDDLIVYDSGPMKYANIGEASMQGVELVATHAPSGRFRLAASYTYTDAVNDVTGLPLVRRPRHKARLNARLRFAERGTLNLDVAYAGEREDFSATLDAYVLVGLSASFDVRDKLNVFARIENLLDEDYEYAAGYGTPGVSVFVGTKATF